MAGSFSLSIILFFGFSAGLDFVKRILPSTRVWQPDFVISCEDEKASVDKDMVTGLRDIDGVSHVFGNMAALDIPVTGIEDTSRITLVSYEEYMFQCAKNHMVSGDFSKISKDRRLEYYNIVDTHIYYQRICIRIMYNNKWIDDKNIMP